MLAPTGLPRCSSASCDGLHPVSISPPWRTHWRSARKRQCWSACRGKGLVSVPVRAALALVRLCSVCPTADALLPHPVPFQSRPGLQPNDHVTVAQMVPPGPSLCTCPWPHLPRTTPHPHSMHLPFSLSRVETYAPALSRTCLDPCAPAPMSGPPAF